MFNVFGDFGELVEQREYDEWTIAYMYSNGVILLVNDYTKIVQRAYLDANECEIGGGIATSLNLEREEVISILGIPYEEYEHDGYQLVEMTYERTDYWFSFLMNKGEAAYSVYVQTKYPM